MRATGFLLTALGALVAGVGAMLDWITVTVPGLPDEVAPTDRGVDLVEGQVALALAVVALVAVLVSRIGATTTARKGAATLTLIAGIGLVVIAGGEALTAETRFVDDAIDDIAAMIENLDEAAAATLEELLEVQLGLGLWLTLAGGVATTAGGFVTLAWASRRSALGSQAVSEVPPDAPDPA